MQRESNLINIIAFMEIQLNSLCDQLSKKNKIQIQVHDLKGRGIERGKNYLSKVLDIKTPWTIDNWKEVKMASAIRNSVIHNECRINEKETKNYIRKSKHLELDDFEKVIIKKTYISYILQEIKQVFEVISREVIK